MTDHGWHWSWSPAWGSACQVPAIKLLFSSHPLPCCAFWKEVTLQSQLLRRGVGSTSWRAECYYINYLKFFCIRDFVSFLLFIYLLYQYGFIGVFFVLWFINQYYFVCSNCYFAHWELFPLAPVFLWCTPRSVFILFVQSPPHSLVLQ